MKEKPIRSGNEILSKKPLIRRASEYMRSRRFELSDNPSVALLEEHLGINFPFTPKKIVVTGNNIAPHKKRYDGFGDGVNVALGHYQYDIDGFFVPENSNLYTELHENMHGFIGYINPKLARKRSFSLEKEITNQFVSEGICEWAATTVSNAIIEERKMSGQDIPDLIKRRDKYSTEKQNDNANVFPDAPTEEMKISLINDLNQLQTMQVHDEESNFDYTWDRKHLGHKAYTVGFYFITSVMNTLLASGMSTNDALLSIISNPPTIFSEIFDPTKFAQTKILAKQS